MTENTVGSYSADVYAYDEHAVRAAKLKVCFSVSSLRGMTKSKLI
jgi:hypothetical protein